MKWMFRLGISGSIAMILVLSHGFINGNFFKDGSVLLQNPWGIVSLVDLYVGFFLFSGWIIYREKSAFSAILWTIGMMVFGFLTGSLYVLYAALTSNKNMKKFWLGKHFNL